MAANPGRGLQRAVLAGGLLAAGVALLGLSLVVKRTSSALQGGEEAPEPEVAAASARAEAPRPA